MFDPFALEECKHPRRTRTLVSTEKRAAAQSRSCSSSRLDFQARASASVIATSNAANSALAGA